MRKIALAAAAVAALVSTAALASVTFDSTTGIGFVGKGDIQLVEGWSDAQLQNNAPSVVTKFSYSTTTVTEVSWICTNSKNENTQERTRTTTTSTAGVVASLARDDKGKNGKVTGFNLTGFGPLTSGTPTTDGQPLNSCPAGFWSLTTEAGEPVVVSQSGGLFYNSIKLGPVQIG